MNMMEFRLCKIGEYIYGDQTLIQNIDKDDGQFDDKQSLYS